MESTIGIVTRSGRRLSVEKSEKDDDVRSTASTPTKKRPAKRMSIKPDLEDVMETDVFTIQEFNDGNAISQIMEENPIPDLLLKELRNIEFNSRNSPSLVKDSPSRNLRKRNTSITSPEDTAKIALRKSPSCSPESIALNSPTKKRVTRKAETSLLQNIVDSPKPRKKRSSFGGLEADTVQDTSTLRRSRRLSTDLNIVVEDPLREEQSEIIRAPVTRKGKRLSTIPLQPSVPEENEDMKDSTLTSPALVQNSLSQRSPRKSPKTFSPDKSLINKSNKEISNLSKLNISSEVIHQDSDLDKTDGKDVLITESKLSVSTNNSISSNNRISMSPKKRALTNYANELTSPRSTTQVNKNSDIQYSIETSENSINKSLSQNHSELNASIGEKAHQSESKLNSSQKSTAGNTTINVSERSLKSLNRSHLDIDENKSVSKNIDESLKLNFSDNFEHNEDNNKSVSANFASTVNKSSLKNNKSLRNSLSEKSSIRDEKASEEFIHDNECQSENIDIGNSNYVNIEESTATSTPFVKSKKEKYKSTPPSSKKSPLSSGMTEESKDISSKGFEESCKEHTPDYEETPKRDKSNSYAQRNNINKSYKSSSEDEDDMKIDFMDSAASDAGSDYQSGDSMNESQREEIEMNEIVEKGESLHTETDESQDTYEKDSFICSSSEESNGKLTSDDATTEMSPLKDNCGRHFTDSNKLSKSSDCSTISKSNNLLSKSQPNLSGSTPKQTKMSPGNISSTGQLKRSVGKESKKRYSSENSNEMSNMNISKSASQTEHSNSSDRTPNSKQATKDLLDESLTNSLEKINANTESKKRLSMNNASKNNYSLHVEGNDSLANTSSNTMFTSNSSKKIKKDRTDKNDFETELSLKNPMNMSKLNVKGEGDILSSSQVNVSAGSIFMPNSTKKIKKDATEKNVSKTRLSVGDSINISKSNEPVQGESKIWTISPIDVSASSISTPSSTNKIKKDSTEKSVSKTKLSLDDSMNISKSHESVQGENYILSNSQMNVSAGSISATNSSKKIRKDSTEKNASKMKLSLDDSMNTSKSHESVQGENDILSNSLLNVSASSISAPNSTKKIKKDSTKKNASKTKLSLDDSMNISKSNESVQGKSDILSNSLLNVSASSISAPNSTKQIKKDSTEKNASKMKLSLNDSMNTSKSHESVQGENDILSNSLLNVSASSISTPNSTKKIKKDSTEKNASKMKLSLDDSMNISKSNESVQGKSDILSNSLLNVSASSISTPNSTKKIKKDSTEKSASKMKLSLDDSMNISKSNESVQGKSDILSNSQMNVSAGSISAPNSTRKIMKDSTDKDASKMRLSFSDSINISKSNESTKDENDILPKSLVNTPSSTKKLKKNTTDKSASKPRLSLENVSSVCEARGAEEESIPKSTPETLSRLTSSKMIDEATDDSKMPSVGSPSVKPGTGHLEVSIHNRSMEKKKNLPMSEVNYNITLKEINKHLKPAVTDFKVESISIENLPIGTKRKLSETDPNWTCTAGEFRVAKKPKARPTRPISVSYAGSTTAFSIVPLKKTPKQVLLVDCEIEPNILNFKQDMLYGNRCPRKDSNKLLQIQQKLKASKNKGSF